MVIEYPIDGITFLFYNIKDNEVKLGDDNSDIHTAIKGDTCPENIQIPGEITSNSITYKVTTIGKKAFYKCSGVKTVNIDDSIQVMEDNCLDYLWFRSEIKLPESLTTLGNWALASNYITKLTIGSKLENIVINSFAGIHSLEEITLNENNPIFSIDEQGALYNKDKTILYLTPAIDTFNVPSSVHYINNYAFAWTKIKHIYIPSSVSHFGERICNTVGELETVHIFGNILNSPQRLFQSSNFQTLYYQGSVPILYDVFQEGNVTEIILCNGYKSNPIFGLKPAIISMNCLAFPYFKCTHYSKTLFLNFKLFLSQYVF